MRAALSEKLIEAREIVQNWRNRQRSGQGRYPEELKIMVVSLAQSENIRAVSDATGISRNLIKKWDHEIPRHKVLEFEENNFVEVASARVGDHATIELLLPCGVVLRTTSDVSPVHLARLCASLKAVR